MAKFVFVAVLLLATVAASMAAPGKRLGTLKLVEGARALEDQTFEESNDHLRFRRLSACAANCISLGKIWLSRHDEVLKLKNPHEEVLKLKNPHEEVLKLKNPHEEVLKLKNPHEEVLKLKNPHEEVLKLKNPHEEVLKMKNPHEEVLKLKNPHEEGSVIKLETKEEGLSLRLETLKLVEGARALEDQTFEESNDHLRFRRLTCDLLGITGDSACAANCISLGKAGGTCHGGICVCRQDTFRERIEERFGPFETLPPFRPITSYPPRTNN